MPSEACQQSKSQRDERHGQKRHCARRPEGQPAAGGKPVDVAGTLGEREVFKRCACVVGAGGKRQRGVETVVRAREPVDEGGGTLRA